MATPKRARTTSSTPRSKKATPATAKEPNVQQQTQGNVYELIRYRAYQYFEQRGRKHGYDVEDWLRAEGEVFEQRCAFCLARFAAESKAPVKY